jgi:GNAT superfamily N-acetyltransferase
MDAPSTISLLGPQNLGAIRTIADWYCNEWDTPAEETVRQLADNPNGNTIFHAVLSVDGQPAATAGLCQVMNIHNVQPHLQRHGPWVARLYTAPAFRNRGFAQQLLAFIEQRAKASGFDKIYLYTYTAEFLYKKLGWTTFEQVPYKGHDTAVMAKNI